MAYRVPRGSQGGQPAPPVPVVDHDWETQFPSLFGWMTDQVGEDGEKRETGTLLLFAEAGKVKGCLSDRHAWFRAFVTAATLQRVLAEADEGLMRGTLDWRPIKDGRRRG